MSNSKDDKEFNKMMSRIMGEPWPPVSSKKSKSNGLGMTPGYSQEDSKKLKEQVDKILRSPSRSVNKPIKRRISTKSKPTIERTVENYGLPRKEPLIRKGRIREDPEDRKKRINRDLRGLTNKELDKLIKEHENKTFRIRGYDPYLDLPYTEREKRKGATDYKKGGQITKRKKGGQIMSGNKLIASLYD
tara:strand:- start:58 stop:624 length:567 start_codon:yes stop_codon:yes gene_type:complete